MTPLSPSRFPQSYVNTALEGAIVELQAAPGQDTLAALLAAALTGGIVLDITGSTSAKDARVRTIASTDGKPVLPLFTSIDRLKRAVAEASDEKETPVSAVIVPARQALELIRTDDFVAVQFNPGPDALVVSRAHVESVLGPA